MFGFIVVSEDFIDCVIHDDIIRFGT
jgi:hypothetical protein